MTDAPCRFTLRQLPVPAKLVISCFLIAVGLGYFSALVQLHLQHSSRSGDHLPGPGDVIEVFSGLKSANGEAGPPKSRIDHVLSGSPTGEFGKNNMSPAFFTKSNGYAEAIRTRGQAVVDAEREGERKTLRTWVTAEPSQRETAYTANKFVLPAELASEPITAAFLDKEAKTVAIKTLIDTRCVKCHGGEQKPDLDTFARLEPHLTTPKDEVLPGGWVRSSRQISIEKLTQSTHAHLLSFAMLFALTGLVFAFTDYPTVLRCVLGAGVLVAQVLDVACWWLARIDGIGWYFAVAIIFTGGVVGLGLAAQILLSLFNMYGPKGKRIVALLLLLGAALFSLVYFKAIAPALDAQRQSAGNNSVVANGNGPSNPAGSQLERVILGPITGLEWNGTRKGSMAAAFFHKSGGGYEKRVKENPAIKDEREGERQAVAAWTRTAEDARKKAYDADAFPLPQDRAGKPITPDYLADEKTVKVKSILADRCARCHTPGADAEEYPLETYEQLLKYLGPEK